MTKLVVTLKCSLKIGKKHQFKILTFNLLFKENFLSNKKEIVNTHVHTHIKKSSGYVVDLK